MKVRFYFRGEPAGEGAVNEGGEAVFTGPAQSIGEHYARRTGLSGEALLRYLLSRLSGHWHAEEAEGDAP